MLQGTVAQGAQVQALSRGIRMLEGSQLSRAHGCCYAPTPDMCADVDGLRCGFVQQTQAHCRCISAHHAPKPGISSTRGLRMILSVATNTMSFTLGVRRVKSLATSSSSSGQMQVTCRGTADEWCCQSDLA